jgi:hypothetical protein
MTDFSEQAVAAFENGNKQELLGLSKQEIEVAYWWHERGKNDGYDEALATLQRAHARNNPAPTVRRQVREM